MTRPDPTQLDVGLVGRFAVLPGSRVLRPRTQMPPGSEGRLLVPRALSSCRWGTVHSLLPLHLEILRRLRLAPERAIGSALMDQELLSGIGNVYKWEVLFITETSPFARVADLDDARLLQIVETARQLMRRNVGGRRRTTPRGRIAAPYWVHERSGELCMRCGARITMQRQDPLARSTYHCPECQPLPRSARACV